MVCNKFPTHSKRKLRILIEKAVREGVEYGAKILANYKIGDEFRGTWYSVPLPPKNGAIGWFHVHVVKIPGVDPLLPSGPNIYNSIAEGYDIICVGGVVELKYVVRCYELKHTSLYYQLKRETISLRKESKRFVGKIERKYKRLPSIPELSDDEMQTYKALLDRFEELGKKAEDNFDNIVKTECEMVV